VEQPAPSNPPHPEGPSAWFPEGAAMFRRPAPTVRENLGPCHNRRPRGQPTASTKAVRRLSSPIPRAAASPRKPCHHERGAIQQMPGALPGRPLFHRRNFKSLSLLRLSMGQAPVPSRPRHIVPEVVRSNSGPRGPIPCLIVEQFVRPGAPPKRRRYVYSCTGTRRPLRRPDPANARTSHICVLLFPAPLPVSTGVRFRGPLLSAQG